MLGCLLMSKELLMNSRRIMRQSIALMLILLSSTAFANDKPNVIVLLADDLGYSGLQCFGSDLHETPHLDKMAADGMKFTSAYSACTVCSPTRASVMTGKYPARLHLTDFISGQKRPFSKLNVPDWTMRLEHSETTIAEYLKRNGYSSAHIGKWHLHGRNDPAEFGPTGRGFDVSIGKPKSRGYFIDQKLVDSGKVKSGYVTDHLTDAAVRVINRWKDKPFFLYFAYNTPHTPIQGKNELVDYYRKKIKPGMRHNNPTYAAMVHSLDDSVGRVIKAVEQAGIADRTLIWFISDNGGLSQKYNKPTGFIDNHPVRRGKGSAYEGGIRVPMIVHWPGVTKPGSVSDEPVCTIDILPTVLEITDSRPRIAGEYPFDGQSLAPIFRDAAQQLNRDALYWHYPHYHAGGDGPYAAIRARRYRLIEFFEDNRLELYDLDNDIGETKNLATEQPKLAHRLHAKLKSWQKSVNAQMPTLNPNYDAVKANQEANGQQPDN
jgi:arylsulfatase A